MSLEFLTWSDWSTSVQVAAPSSDTLAEVVAITRSVMADVALAASRFEPGTDVLRVNAAAGDWVTVSPTMLTLVAEACRVAELTSGLVTPLIGGALIGVGYDRDISLVGGNQVTVVPVTGRWQDIALSGDAVRIPAGSQLDLGASAKAWTADEIARRAHSRLGEPVLASIGGDVAVAGELADGFLIEVAERAEATDADAPSQRIRISDGGVATSTTVIRRWHSTSDVMHHILDPRTALPAVSPYRTASVAAATCSDANAASTAAIIMGEAAPAWLARAGLPARLITGSGDVVTMGNWPDEPA